MNKFRQFLNLLPSSRIDVGEVTATSADGVIVLLQGGGTIRVKGSATVGEKVYIQRGVITGPAPSLTGVDIEI